MATIKSYTSLEQAKVLLKILPHQSADMSFNVEKDYEVILHPYMTSPWIGVPCWSLAALLSVLPKEIVYNKNIVYLEFHVWQNSLEYVNNADYILYITKSYDNPVDACYEMVLKLHKLKLL